MSASQAHAARRSVLAAGLVAGVAFVPAGIALAKRPDEVSQSIGIGMIVGGAAPLAFSMLSVFESRMERFEREYERRMVSEMPADELVARTEADWRRLAEEGHDRRILTGLIEIGIGSVATAGGVGLLLAPPFGGMSRNQQYNVGAALVGPGVPILALGLRGLLQRTTEENGFSAYEAATGRAHPENASSSIESFQLVPIAHGAFASIHFHL